MSAEAQAQTQAPGTPVFAMLRTLGGVATLSGLLVVLVFKLTLPAIEQNQREAIERAIFHVVPGSVSRVDYVVQGDSLKKAEGGEAGELIYAAYDAKGKLKGIAMQAAQQGYQDVIKMLYGYDPACQCITGIKILKMTETPGLGDKIAFDLDFLKNFEALDASLNAQGTGLANNIVAVRSGGKTENWQIDSISGATVSSVAVGKALDKSAQRVAPVIQTYLAELQSPDSRVGIARKTGFLTASPGNSSGNIMAALPNQEEKVTLDTFLRGLWEENPVFVMLLGMCPVLAVTNSTMNALAMGLATTFVLVMSSALVSLLRKSIPKQVRIATYIIIIATFVTIVDYSIQAISLDLYNALGAFIQLIVANCVILGRAEAYASKQKLGAVLVNSLGMGAGFTIALLCLGTVREILGNGTILGFQLFADNFQPWVVMILPPGGFFVLGAWLLLFAWLKQRKDARLLETEGATANGR